MSKFQLIFSAFCLIFLVAGVAIFALTKDSAKSARGSTVIWGTVSQVLVDGAIAQLRTTQGNIINISYVQKSNSTFDQEFIEALALGAGPDVILLSQDSILRHQDKVIPVPYQTFSEGDFRNTFIQEGELYLSSSGTLALPLLVDPLVMYWNRDLFANVGLATPPKLWEDFLVLVPKFTERKGTAQTVITKSAVALGEYRNIENSKEILSTLLFQAGTPIVSRNTTGGGLQSVLDMQGQGSNFSPGESALRFYTQFADPQKPTYSWNRSLSSAQARFLSGDVAVYFGFASELATIRGKNPNLNFDVALVPQSKLSVGTPKMTFGKMYALALVRGSKNPTGSIANIFGLTGSDTILAVASASGLPPVRRDVLAVRPTDAYQGVLYDSALIARAWFDPNKQETDRIFAEMVESVSSGRLRVSEAVRAASNELEAVLK